MEVKRLEKNDTFALWGNDVVLLSDKIGTSMIDNSDLLKAFIVKNWTKILRTSPECTPILYAPAETKNTVFLVVITKEYYELGCTEYEYCEKVKEVSALNSKVTKVGKFLVKSKYYGIPFGNEESYYEKGHIYMIESEEQELSEETVYVKYEINDNGETEEKVLEITLP